MIRRLWKTVAGRGLGGRIADFRIRRQHARDSLVLAFHNVVPDDESPRGDQSLHLPLSTFVELMDRLLEVFSPRRLEDVLSVADSPGMAITFDDAYRGALTLALPELSRRGIPATVFVPTSRIGNQDFWWDVLAAGGDGLDPGMREFALEELRGDEQQVRAWARGENVRCQSMPDLWRSGTVEELIVASTMDGVVLAPHSATHRALDRLPEDELLAELRDPLQWFRANGLPCRSFVAYPYGRSSPSVLAAAESVGYEGGWLVSGGWTSPTSTIRFALPRLNVPAGASVSMLMVRIAGFLGE